MSHKSRILHNNNYSARDQKCQDVRGIFFLVWGEEIEKEDQGRRAGRSVDLFGLRVDNLDADEAIKMALREGQGTCWVVTPNAVMLDACRRDALLCSLLNRADLSVADGAGVLLAARRQGTPLRARVAGIELGERLLAGAAESGLRVFLLGGKKGVAKKAALALKKRHPRLTVCGTHHGYFDKDKDCRDNGSVIRSINNAKADILFVCFGFPLQERWIAENLPSLPSLRLAMGLGGSLDVWSGNIRRAPSWVQSIGLEWLWRAFREPKRAKRLLSLPKGLVSAITTKECRS